MPENEAFSTKLYAFALNPRIIRNVRGKYVTISDVSMAIIYSPTLSQTVGMDPENLLLNASISTSGGFLRMIEYPSSEKLRVTEAITKYEHENPVPSWLGWIIGMLIVMILENLLMIYVPWFPTWFLWLLIFIPIGMGWQYIFKDKKYYLVEIYISGQKDLVLRFVRDLRNNLGREPLLVYRGKDLRLFEKISGLNLSALDAHWHELLKRIKE